MRGIGGKLSKLQPLEADAPGQSILVVDDSRSIREVLASLIGNMGGFTVESATSLAETRKLIENNPERFFCAALDLNLPDAADGEVVDLVSAAGIPVVVLTATMSASIRDKVRSKGVVDYVVKESATEIEQVAYIIGRLRENGSKKVLIVDDSQSFRNYLDVLLKRYCFQNLQAANGQQALALLDEHPDTTLVITDVNMPVMGGIELIAHIRRRYRREDLTIIGLSDASKPGVSTLLLKAGANDFIAKPFEVEEFYCRVTQNTNMVGYVRQIRDLATRDYLTGAYNRRHLFEVGGTLYANARRESITIAAAVIDADHFKRINDTFGHHAGDLALSSIVTVLQSNVRDTDVVARYGGEEFVVIAVVKEADHARIVFERLRASIEAIKLVIDGHDVPVRVSIGYTTTLGESLASMIDLADRAVFGAKDAGRNCVVRL